jgi:AraC family transcriptional activator FtrA
MTAIVKIMPKSAPASRHSLVIVAYDGLCLFEFSTALETLGPPPSGWEDRWYDVTVAAADAMPLRAGAGIRLAIDGGLELIERAETIVVPGWRAVGERVPDTLIEALQRAQRRGCRFVSICTGSFVLAAAGLLDGRRATTHWQDAELFSTSYPTIDVEPSVLYVDEGDILTSAGCAAGLDVCLHLIRRDYGPIAANRVAQRMVVPPHRQGGQAQFVDQPLPVRENAALAPLLDTLRSRIDADLNIDALAAETRMSRRTFLRRFHDATGMTPGEWLLGLRLERARSLLETTRISIEQVAQGSGFGSAETLRHHFRVRMGTSPTAYRQQFSSVAA